MNFKSKTLQTLFERNFIKDCSNLEKLDSILANEKITVYCGCDLTAPSLHIGNLMTLMMLKIFYDTGHNIIILLGGATTKIGDPTGKDLTRKILTDYEIEQNLDGIKSNLSQFFNIYNKRVKIVNNADWFTNVNYIDFLRDVGKHFTVNRMIAMDSVKLRLEREQAMNFVEFNYMLIQGYDFVHLRKNHQCTLQIGGSDQWGNITQGIDLSSRMGFGEVFGLTCPLITRSDGAKMGKSENGAIWLSPSMLSAYDYYQYFRNVPDPDVQKLLLYYTELSTEEIAQMCAVSGKDLNIAKEILALEATRICRGEEAAKMAHKTAKDLFELGQAGGDVTEITIPLNSTITEACTQSGLCSSNSEVRRMIDQSAIKVDDICVDKDFSFVKTGGYKLSLGKKKHCVVQVV